MTLTTSSEFPKPLFLSSIQRGIHIMNYMSQIDQPVLVALKKDS